MCISKDFQRLVICHPHSLIATFIPWTLCEEESDSMKKKRTQSLLDRRRLSYWGRTPCDCLPSLCNLGDLWPILRFVAHACHPIDLKYLKHFIDSVVGCRKQVTQRSAQHCVWHCDTGIPTLTAVTCRDCLLLLDESCCYLMNLDITCRDGA